MKNYMSQDIIEGLEADLISLRSRKATRPHFALEAGWALSARLAIVSI